MTSWFRLTLDTHAPQITWGAAAGTTAGELLRLPYTLDEPGIVSATLRLPDGRSLALTDTGTELQVLLPADTAAGNATASVLVRDEVLNAATRTHVVTLQGVIVIPPPAPDQVPRPAGGLPRRRRPPATRTVTTTARLAARGRARVDAHAARYPATAIPTSRSRVLGAGSTTSSVHAGARSRVISRPPVSRDSTRRLGTRARVIRRDGPSLEEALALDLL